MNDMSPAIVPKSDQWNADDFIAGPITFTIADVCIRGGQEQPVNIRLQGHDKAFRPCKSMCRALVFLWGADASKYIGRSLTLYRDEKVKWGGLEVGGIRISHASHIDRTMVMQLTATRGSRRPHVVLPLVADNPAAASDPIRAKAEKWANNHIDALKSAASLEELNGMNDANEKILNSLKERFVDLYQKVDIAIADICEKFQ